MASFTCQLSVESVLSKDKPIVILNDGEPDDILAILLILQCMKNSGFPISIVVSSWTDVEAKAQHQANLLRLCTSPRIFRAISWFVGLPGKQKFLYSPIEGAHKFVLQSFTELNVKDSLIIGLCPPRELLHWFRADPSCFQQCDLVHYASFNFRTLLQKGQDADELARMLNSFETTFLYETFPLLGDSSKADDPDDSLVSFIKSEYPLVAKAISEWNEHIAHSLRKSPLDPNGYEIKILQSMEKNPHQFLLADVGMVAWLVTTKLQSMTRLDRGQVSWPAPRFFTTITPTESGSIHFVSLATKEEQQKFKETQLRMIQDILTQ